MSSSEKLSDYLKRQMEARSWGLKEIAASTGVSQTALHNILNNPEEVVPKLETLSRLAGAFELPLWRVIEMAGFDPGLPTSPDALGRRLTALSDRVPEFRQVAEKLTTYDRQDVQAVLAYMEALEALRR